MLRGVPGPKRNGLANFRARLDDFNEVAGPGAAGRFVAIPRPLAGIESGAFDLESGPPPRTDDRIPHPSGSPRP
jgi:hypothetical protein